MTSCLYSFPNPYWSSILSESPAPRFNTGSLDFPWPFWGPRSNFWHQMLCAACSRIESLSVSPQVPTPALLLNYCIRYRTLYCHSSPFFLLHHHDNDSSRFQKGKNLKSLRDQIAQIQKGINWWRWNLDLHIFTVSLSLLYQCWGNYFKFVFFFKIDFLFSFCFLSPIHYNPQTIGSLLRNGEHLIRQIIGHWD